MQTWLWLAFFASFAVKMPMWPVHTWLPDAHVEAPTAGSVILAGVLLKMGGYGFLRFSLPMFPDASVTFAPLVFTLSVIAIIYTSLVALVQEDMKKLIAYSSVAHMGFVTMGLFSFTEQGIQGAIFQMVSHGIVSSALFLCVGVIYDRMHTREIAAYGGLVERMPRYAVAFLIFTMANVGLPGTSGFVGEFLTLLGTFRVNSNVTLFATIGVILSAAYALYLYRRVVFGVLDKETLKSILDLNGREIALLVPLVLLTILYGVHPAPILDSSAASVSALVKTHEAAIAPANKLASAMPRLRNEAPLSFALSPMPAGVHPRRRRAGSAAVRRDPRQGVGRTADRDRGRAARRRDPGHSARQPLDATVFNGLFIDDAFGRFMKVLALLGSLITLVMGQDFLARESVDKFEYPILVVLSTLGCADPRLGERRHRALSRARADVARALRVGRLPPRRPARLGSRHQIFRPRLALLGHAALRRLAALRLLRHGQLHRHRRGDERPRLASASSSASCS